MFHGGGRKLFTVGHWLFLLFHTFPTNSLLSRSAIKLGLIFVKRKDAMKIINSDKAPAPIGPYSQAVEANGMIFLSGQIAIDRDNDNRIPPDVESQTRQVIKNMRAVLAEAGSALDKVVKTTIYLADMNDFAAVNSIYAEYFDASKPARATVEVSRLPKDVKIEIDCIALK